jgi:hypothetical protein
MIRSLKISVALAVIVIVCVVYVRNHPLVFNESFFGHAHCITGGGLALVCYASGHFGNYPCHTNGYGDALLLMTNEVGGWWASVTGPGYSERPFLEALASGTHLPDVACGRVYIQGLSETNDPNIALLFDKLPTPGGDHCHFFRRLWTPLSREVWTLGGATKTIRESNWPDFVRKQIELLIAAGIPRKEAERLYATPGN